MEAQIVRQAAEQTSKNIDAAIREALRRCGVGDATRAALEGRLTQIHWHGSPIVEYRLDDHPILRYRPPYNPHTVEEGHAIKFRLNYDLSILVDDDGNYLEGA